MTETLETYGPYGGRYVPETLIPALDELDAAWRAALTDPAYREEIERPRPHLHGPALPDHAGAAVRARQAALPQARGPQPHGSPQDQQRARPGRARAPAREDADHRRDRRRPARRRDRDRLRALRARVRRLHGLRGHAPAGAQRRADASARRHGRPRRVRHADAEGGDERGDPRLDHERRDDALRDRLVRRPCPLPGDRARAAGCDRARGARATARGGGGAARGGRGVRRRRLQRDRHVRRVRRRSGGPARRRRGRRRSVARRRPHRRPARLALLDPRRRATARSPTRTRSPPVSTTPASAPSTRSCATPAGPSTSPAPTRRRSRRSAGSRETEGIIPALESSHALAVVDSLDAEYVVRLPLGARRQGPRRGADGARDARERAQRGEQGPRHLPDGGRRHARLAAAAVEGGADIVEIGFPFSDPLADGP